MSENLFSEKLAWFKENEKPEAVLLVADDPKKIKLVIAWSNMQVRCKRDIAISANESESEIWNRLWEQIDFSSGELIEKSSLFENEVNKILKHLKGNRVIYPDGTVNSFVQKYLREKVINLFTSKVKSNSKAKISA